MNRAAEILKKAARCGDGRALDMATVAYFDDMDAKFLKLLEKATHISEEKRAALVERIRTKGAAENRIRERVFATLPGKVGN